MSTEISSLACSADMCHIRFKCTPVSTLLFRVRKDANLLLCSGCWTNALQPLWIAGKVMSHYSEHGAIVETLVRIERETGWATAWRVEDLKDFWGDYDNDDECDVDM